MLFTANAGDNNRLYGSVTSTDIGERLSEAVGFEIDRRRIVLDQGLRELGIFDLTVRLMPDVTPSFTVAVVREGEGWPEAEARAAAQAAVEAAEAEETAEVDEENPSVLEETT